jgi:hypothetical protein
MHERSTAGLITSLRPSHIHKSGTILFRHPSLQSELSNVVSNNVTNMSLRTRLASDLRRNLIQMNTKLGSLIGSGTRCLGHDRFPETSGLRGRLWDHNRTQGLHRYRQRGSVAKCALGTNLHPGNPNVQPPLSATRNHISACLM